MKMPVFLIISVVILIALLSNINFSELTTVFAQIDYQLIVVSFLIYILTFIFRTTRFHILFANRISKIRMFQTVLIHYLFNIILPARTGELSFVFLNKEYGIKSGHSVGFLTYVRIVDIVFISIIMIVSALLINKADFFIEVITSILISVSLLIILFIIFVVKFKDGLISFYDRVTIMLRINKFRLVPLIRNKILEFNESISTINREVFIKTILVSVLVLVSIYTGNIIFLFAFGIEISLVEAVFISSILLLIPIIPFHGFGGFGTFELTLSVFLIILGIPNSIAILTSFGIHILSLLFTIILGGFALAIKNYEKISKG